MANASSENIEKLIKTNVFNYNNTFLVDIRIGGEVEKF